jgi:hypothetical protein
MMLCSSLGIRENALYTTPALLSSSLYAYGSKRRSDHTNIGNFILS